MKILSIATYIFIVFFSGLLNAKDYMGFKYEAAYVDWNKIEGIDLDEILSTNINLADFHYGREFNNNYGEIGVFVSDSANRSHSANSILGDSLIHFTLDSTHTLMGVRAGGGSKFAITDNLYFSANGNLRYVEQEVEIKNATIKGSSTWKSKVNGTETGATVDAGIGLHYNSGENANLFVQVNGYLSPIGDIDSMGSANVGLNIKF